MCDWPVVGASRPRHVAREVGPRCRAHADLCDLACGVSELALFGTRTWVEAGAKLVIGLTAVRSVIADTASDQAPSSRASRPHGVVKADISSNVRGSRGSGHGPSRTQSLLARRAMAQAMVPASLRWAFTDVVETRPAGSQSHRPTPSSRSAPRSSTDPSRDKPEAAAELACWQA